MTRAGHIPLVLLCTGCGHVFEPDLVAAVSETGCERCGGWTWIADSGSGMPDLPAPRASEQQRLYVAQGGQ